MFYDNILSEIKTKTKSKFIGKFSNSLNSDIDVNVMAINQSPLTYNFNYSDGALRDGMGVKKLQFRSSELYHDEYKVLGKTTDSSFITACWLFNSWTDEFNFYRPFVVFYTSKGTFFYNRIHSNDPELYQIEGLNFTETPIVTSCKINGKDVLILVSEADGMYTWQYPFEVHKIENAPSISSMCVHNNRLYVTTQGEKRVVMFSDSLDPTNFSLDNPNCGVIEMVDEFGKSNKVISFKENLYVFRDFNIAKLVTFEDRSDINVSQLYVSNSRIYDKTVCICGNKVLYLANDGVYVFDGINSKKMSLNMNNLFNGMDNSNAVAGYSNGNYYLSCTLNFNDNEFVGDEIEDRLKYNNALVKINIEKNEVSILRGYDIQDICVINDILKCEVCLIVNENHGGYSIGVLDENGKIFDTPTEKIWKSAKTDFGAPEKIKLVKEVSFETSQDITVEIETENETRSFNVNGRIGYQTIKPYVKGKNIGINFRSNKAGNYISNPKIVVRYYE